MESWEDGSAIHELVLAIPDGLIPGMHRHGLSVWVNDPDCLSAGPDVVGHLRCDLAVAEARGDQLYNLASHEFGPLQPACHVPELVHGDRSDHFGHHALPIAPQTSRPPSATWVLRAFPLEGSEGAKRFAGVQSRPPSGSTGLSFRRGAR